MSEKMYYFAYASNMNKAQMAARCSRPRLIEPAKLSNYRLAFFGYSKTWDSALETLLDFPGHDVWGLLYELSSADMESLDGYQDARMDGAGAYFHYPSRAFAADGTSYSIRFYKKDYLGEVQLPSTEYLDFIIKGAEEGGLPASYVKELRVMPSKKASFPVPRPEKDVRRYFECSGCDE